MTILNHSFTHLEVSLVLLFVLNKGSYHQLSVIALQMSPSDFTMISAKISDLPVAGRPQTTETLYLKAFLSVSCCCIDTDSNAA